MPEVQSSESCRQEQSIRLQQQNEVANAQEPRKPEHTVLKDTVGQVHLHSGTQTQTVCTWCVPTRPTNAASLSSPRWCDHVAVVARWGVQMLSAHRPAVRLDSSAGLQEVRCSNPAYWSLELWPGHERSLPLVIFESNAIDEGGSSMFEPHSKHDSSKRRTNRSLRQDFGLLSRAGWGCHRERRMAARD